MKWLVIDFLGTDAYESHATRHSVLELQRDINSTIYRVKLIKRAGVERSVNFDPRPGVLSPGVLDLAISALFKAIYLKAKIHILLLRTIMLYSEHTGYVGVLSLFIWSPTHVEAEPSFLNETHLVSLVVLCMYLVVP